MLENKLSSGLDIDLTTYDLGIIKQPKVRDLMNLPYDESELTLPFLMIERQYHELLKVKDIDFDFTRLDILPIVEEQSETYRIETRNKEIQNNFFDPFIEKKKSYSFSSKIFTLFSILYDCSPESIKIIPDEEKGGFSILIVDKAIITRKNFDVLLKVIFKIFAIDMSFLEDNEDEWVELTGSEKEKEMIRKFKEKERQKREKEKLRMCDFLMFLVVRDNRNFQEILDWTYFQLIHVYRSGLYYNRTKMDERILCSGNTTMTGKDILNWQKEVKFEIDKTIY